MTWCVLQKMKDIIGDKSPEFWPESHCPFFSLPTGRGSCYSDEMTASLATMARLGPATAPADIAAEIQTVFGAADSPYQVALAKRAEKKYPISGPWLNSGVIKSLENMTSGKQPPGSEACEDNDGFTTALPTFLLTLDTGKAKEVANLVTVNSVAMAHFKVQNLILANYVNKVADPVTAARDAIQAECPEVAREMDEVLAAVAAGLSVAEIVAKFGKACGLPGSFQGALAAVLLAPDYVSAVRANIAAGGDCCARANYLGAVLGAKLGIEAVPMEWIEKVTDIGNILENTVKVFASSK